MVKLGVVVEWGFGHASMGETLDTSTNSVQTENLGGSHHFCFKWVALARRHCSRAWMLLDCCLSAEGAARALEVIVDFGDCCATVTR